MDIIGFNTIPDHLLMWIVKTMSIIADHKESHIFLWRCFLFGIEMSPECQMLNTHSPDSVTFAAW